MMRATCWDLRLGGWATGAWASGPVSDSARQAMQVRVALTIQGTAVLLISSELRRVLRARPTIPVLRGQQKVSPTCPPLAESAQVCCRHSVSPKKAPEGPLEVPLGLAMRFMR